MNIIIVRECSNRCPYCFEVTERERMPKSILTIDSAQSIAEWMKGSEESIGLIGGEPFLHPKIFELVTLFKSVSINNKITIFTGGIVPARLLKSLSADGISILVNVNEERDYANKAAYLQMRAFLEDAIGLGFEVAIGYNLWRLDFDTDYIPNLAFELGRKSFRWTVANPICGKEKNNIVSSNNFKLLSRNCMAMLSKAVELGISTTLDCHLPLCFFNDSDLAWLSKNQKNVVSQLGMCTPPIDITPELEAIRCFSLSTVLREAIFNHKNPAALRIWFEKNLDESLLKQKPIFKECSECEHFYAARCQGGCFGWRDTLKRDEPPLPARLYEMLRLGKTNAVIDEIEKSSHWFLSPLSFYFAALAALDRGDYISAKRYAALSIQENISQDLREKVLELLQRLKNQHRRGNAH